VNPVRCLMRNRQLIGVLAEGLTGRPPQASADV
jgi:hypothetical protein